MRVTFENAGKRRGFFSGPVDVVTFGSEQYVWISDGTNSHADPDHAPAGAVVASDSQTTYTLPKASITVLRGKVQGIRD